MISTLEKLLQLRHQAVEKLTGQLSQQKQLCSRYENNINALTALSDSAHSVNAFSAALLTNESDYKKNIQRVINWQKQEQALADNKARELQIRLRQQACREKIVEVILEQQQQTILLAQTRQEQKITDGISTQCWMRRHAG